MLLLFCVISNLACHRCGCWSGVLTSSCWKTDNRFSCLKDSLADAEERIEQLIGQKVDYESQLKDLEERLSEAEGDTDALEATKRKMEDRIEGLEDDIQNMEASLAKVCGLH